MPSYFGLWHFRPELLTPDPNMQVQMYEAFLGLYKSQVHNGELREVYAFEDGIHGYYVTGDISPEKLLMVIQQGLPFVTSEVHQTVKFPVPIENNVAIAKARAEMMK